MTARTINSRQFEEHDNGSNASLKVLSAVDVKALPVGMKLYLIGPDKYGMKNVEEGIIEQLGNARSKRFRVDRPDGIVRPSNTRPTGSGSAAASFRRFTM